MTTTTVTRKVDVRGHLAWEKIQTENALQGRYHAEQKFFYEKAKEIEAQKTNKMINRMESGREIKAREVYYQTQTKLAEASIAKIEGETKVLVAGTAKTTVNTHCTNALTVVLCLGCIGFLTKYVHIVVTEVWEAIKQ